MKTLENVLKGLQVLLVVIGLGLIMPILPMPLNFLLRQVSMMNKNF